MIKLALKWLTGGALDRILETVDKKTAAGADRDKLRADIIKTHYETRSDFMRAGGFWLMLLFAIPLAGYWAAVLATSVFWCPGCAYPKDWHIAALPAPLDQWAGGIVTAIFLVIGADRWGRR